MGPSQEDHHLPRAMHHQIRERGQEDTEAAVRRRRAMEQLPHPRRLLARGRRLRLLLGDRKTGRRRVECSASRGRGLGGNK